MTRSHIIGAKMALNNDIDYVKLYRRKQLIFHGYVLPFLIIHLTIIYSWTFIYGFYEYFELGCIAFAVAGVIQVLTCLSCHWSIHVRALLTCLKVRFSCTFASTAINIAAVIQHANFSEI